MMVILSMITLTACGISLEERVVKILEGNFNTLFEVSYSETDNRFDLLVTDEELKGEIELLFDGEVDTKEVWSHLQANVIEVSEGIVDLIGLGYAVRLNYFKDNSIEPLVIVLDGEVIDTMTNFITVEDYENSFNLDKRLGITAEAVYDAINSNRDFDWLRYSDWIDGYRIATAQHQIEPIRFVGLYEPDIPYLSTVAFVVPEDTDKTPEENFEYWIDYLDRYQYWYKALSLVNDKTKELMGSDDIEIQPYEFGMGNFVRDGFRVFMFKLEDSSHGRSDYPLTAEDIFGNDFFADNERVADYQRFYRAGDFRGLNELVNTYLAEIDEIDESDSVVSVMELLKPIMEVMDQIEVVYDDFNDVATIYYKGVTEISAHHHFVPYTTTANNQMSAKIGFQNDDWLYFTKIEISLGNDRMTFRLNENDVLQDTISANLIHEVTTISLTNKHFDQFLRAAENPVIHFTGANQQILDVEFTEAEMNAVKVLSVFQDTNAFPNLLYNWNR